MSPKWIRGGSVALLLTLFTACSAAGRSGAAPAASSSARQAGASSVAVASSPAGSVGGFDVAAENAKPGTAAWTIAPSAAGPQQAVQGYADQISVLSGESFRLFVSTTSPQFTATAYRMGYYGGAGAREVWQSPHVNGILQTAETFDRSTNTVECDWLPSLTVPTSGWPEGDYLIKLVALDGAGQRYVPITVRSASTAGRVILVAGVTTWQAYNGWGGYSLYGGPKKHSDSLRSRAVSFDRPYLDYGPQNGAGLYLPFDQGLVMFAEQQGLPVAYETDLELQTHPELFRGSGTSKGPAAIVSDAHDEYYSAGMRGTLANARDSGVNLAFLGANDVYRHIRWGSTQLGADRLVICYKDALSDPMYDIDASQTTQNWRDTPFPRPENALTGSYYYQCDPARAAYVVYDPGNWLFAGTGAAKGSAFPGLVWPEYDNVVDIPTTPHPIEVLSHSPLTCKGHPSYQESAYYTVRSGAGVFDAGTMQWVCALEAQFCTQVAVTPAGERFVRQVTLNLLRTFAQGPAGRAHPAIDNTIADQVPTWSGPGAGAD